MNFKIASLTNGAKLITAPLHDTKVVTVLIMFKVGSRYEPKNINGVSHFLEHLFFKGTKNRPSTLEISHELDSVGAAFNAFTSKEYTGYYIKLESHKLPLALDMLSDMLCNSLFDPKEIERERGVIIEEINMYEDNPMATVEEDLELLLYGENTLGRTIAGPKTTIQKITRNQILNYRKTHYHASNMIVAIAGKIDEKNIQKEAEKFFGDGKIPRKGKIRYEKIAIKQTKPRLHLKHKTTEQVHVAFGWPALAGTDANLEALQVLTIILGGNMSSRLFISIRERKGLCYFIRSSVNPYEDVGNVVIQAGIDKQRIEPALKAILEEVDILLEKGITDKELQKAKDFVRGKLVLQLEDSEEIASWLTQRALFTPKVMTPEEKMKKLDAVTKEDVMKIARKIFRKNLLNLAIIGPFDSAKPFEKIIGASSKK